MHSDLLRSIDAVLELEKYKPTIVVNNSFTDLVHNIINMRREPFDVPQDKLEKLRTASMLAENELETHWAKEIIGSAKLHKALEKFPYINNYRELVARELSCVAASGIQRTGIRTALVVGSGPLPLTALCLSDYGVGVDHIDSSAAAMALCEGITSALKVGGDCVLSAGESAVLTKQYDLIILAALAGTDQVQKQAIIGNTLPYLSSNGRILVRSAKGARELLYPALQPHGFRGIKLLHEYHPDDYVINSVLVYARQDEV